MDPQTLADIKRNVLFDQTVSFIGLFSPEGVVLDFNTSMLDFFGRTLDEMRDKLLWELEEFNVKPEETARMKDAIAVAGGGEMTQFETEIMARGMIRTYDLILKPISNEQNVIIAILAEGWDITERKRRETTLLRNEELYRMLARSTPGTAFAVFDYNLRFILVEGELWTKYLKMPKETTEGKTLFEVFSKKAVERVEPYLRAALRGESKTIDHVGVSEGIAGHPILLTYKPIPNPDGSIDAGLLVAIDLESLRQKEGD